jgi:hypothetical protein
MTMPSRKKLVCATTLESKSGNNFRSINMANHFNLLPKANNKTLKNQVKTTRW